MWVIRSIEVTDDSTKFAIAPGLRLRKDAVTRGVFSEFAEDNYDAAELAAFSRYLDADRKRFTRKRR